MLSNFYIDIAIIAYLMFAVNAIIDKFLLKKAIPHATTYAFFIGILSGSAILLFPFDYKIPAPHVIFSALFSGAIFIYAMATFYQALRKVDATHVLPLIGALVPIFTFVLSWFAVGEWLSNKDFGGLIFLIAGTVAVTYGTENGESRKRGWLAYTILAALLFSFSFTMAKSVYLEQSFISGLVWTRIGCVLGALTLLFLPHAYTRIRDTVSVHAKATVGGLFIIGQILGAGGSILQNYAIALGKVTLVNALQGTQYVFLFILTWFITRYYPHILVESFSGRNFWSKISGTALIVGGLLLIA